MEFKRGDLVVLNSAVSDKNIYKKTNTIFRVVDATLNYDLILDVVRTNDISLIGKDLFGSKKSFDLFTNMHTVRKLNKEEKWEMW